MSTDPTGLDVESFTESPQREKTGEPVALPSEWRELQTIVEAALEHAVRRKEGCPERLQTAMRYALTSGGKRLRPILALLAAKAVRGGDFEPNEPGLVACAAAVEMIHAYSLTHDDLPAMDDDDLRRGRPTVHIEFDPATAILAGDGLLTLAFETLATEPALQANAGRCCGVLASAAGWRGMVGGQMDDITAETHGLRGDGEAELSAALMEIHRRKTGRLIEASLELGAIAAGAGDAERHRLCRYGRAIGLAFQITDDLLDVEGDPELVGKPLRKDAGAGKLTYPGLWGIDRSRREAESLEREALEAIAPFGPAARPLAELARFVVERDH